MKRLALLLLAVSAFAQRSIVVVDSGTVKLGANAVTVVQKQLTRDFAPAWGVTATLRYTTVANDVRTGEVAVWIKDTEAGCWYCTGFVATRTLDVYGKPIIQIFMDKVRALNIAPAYVLGHELMEYLVNPQGTFQVLRSDIGQVKVYRLEICDAVQRHMYTIDGLLVSNFTLPAFWGIFNGPYDYMNKILSPFGTTEADGELSFFTVVATI